MIKVALIKHGCEIAHIGLNSYSEPLFCFALESKRELWDCGETAYHSGGGGGESLIWS